MRLVSWIPPLNLFACSLHFHFALMHRATLRSCSHGHRWLRSLKFSIQAYKKLRLQRFRDDRGGKNKQYISYHVSLAIIFGSRMNTNPWNDCYFGTGCSDYVFIFWTVLVFFPHLYIIRVFYPMAGLSLQTLASRLHFCQKAGLPLQTQEPGLQFY